jgi:putative ABC transport system permease protein
MNRGSLRVALRLGSGAARRGRWRSVLVIVLITLPVMAMAAGSSILATVTPTPERTAISRMGAADLRLDPLQPDATLPTLQKLLPSGSKVELVAETNDRVVGRGTDYGVRLSAMDIGGLARGMLTLLSGRTPTALDEVAISPAVADLAGVSLGDSITLRGLGSVKVVGTVEDPGSFPSRVVLADPARASQLVDPVGLSFLVSLPAGSSIADLPDSIQLGISPAVASTSTLTDPVFAGISREAAAVPSENQTGLIFVIGGLALVEAALVASAAFAVSIRRRQRELGLLGAVGGEPGHLAATVFGEAMLLGLVGAVAGLIVGSISAFALAPWLDQLTGRRNPPVELSVGSLAIAGGIGLLAALIAAGVPARTAARVPILAALSGRRPPSTPARRTLRLGIVTIVIAFFITLAGAWYQVHEPFGNFGITISLLLAGAVLGVLGFGACSPWLLERLESVAARLPLSPRLALRDTARFRSRNGPIVTAVLAGFAATVALAAILSSQDARNAQYYTPLLRPDQLIIAGPGAETVGPQVANELGAVGSASLLLGGPPVLPTTGAPDGQIYVDIGGYSGPGNMYVGDSNLLKAVGAESAQAAFDSGSLILLTPDTKVAPQATVKRFHDDGRGEDLGKLPVYVVHTAESYAGDPGIIASAQTASSLGIIGTPTGSWLVRLPHPVTGQDTAVATDRAAAVADTAANWEVGPQHLGEAFRLLVLLASLVFALSVTGVAVALGEAEARPDQRTLLALGADPSVRRRITAARAGVLASIAGVLAVPAGLLPAWGLLLSRSDPLVVPLPEVLAALAVLPLAAVVGAAVLSRPIPRWSTYRREGA